MYSFELTKSQPKPEFFASLRENTILIGGRKIQFDLAVFGVFNKGNHVQPLIINKLLAENITDSKNKTIKSSDAIKNEINTFITKNISSISGATALNIGLLIGQKFK